MKATEFYQTPEGEVSMRPVGEAERLLKPEDTEVVEEMLTLIQEYYPTAWIYTVRAYQTSNTVITLQLGGL